MPGIDASSASRCFVSSVWLLEQRLELRLRVDADVLHVVGRAVLCRAFVGRACLVEQRCSRFIAELRIFAAVRFIQLSDEESVAASSPSFAAVSSSLDRTASNDSLGIAGRSSEYGSLRRRLRLRVVVVVPATARGRIVVRHRVGLLFDLLRDLRQRVVELLRASRLAPGVDILTIGSCSSLLPSSGLPSAE